MRSLTDFRSIYILGNSFPGPPQSGVALGAEGREGKVHFGAARRRLGKRHHLGHAGRHHRESRLAVWLLHPRHHHFRVRRALVRSRRGFSRLAPEDIEEGTRTHSGIARRHRLKSQATPAGVQRAHILAVPRSYAAALRLALGPLLPSNSRTDVHDRSFELQLVQGRNVVGTSTSRASSCWVWIRCDRRLHPSTELPESHNDPQIFLLIL